MTNHNFVEGVEVIYVETPDSQHIPARITKINRYTEMYDGPVNNIFEVIDIEYKDTQGNLIKKTNVHPRETKNDSHCYKIASKRLKNNSRAAWLVNDIPCYTNSNLPLEPEDLKFYQNAK